MKENTKGKVKLTVNNLSLLIREKQVLDNVNFDVKEKELVTLLGKSGSGKTMILKLICGFVAHQDGNIILDEKNINKLPINKRRVSIVDQDLCLFDHMSVFDNIAFGLKVKGVNKDIIHSEVTKMLEEMQLLEHADKYPDELSGGQKQRVAIARSLIIKPSLLLLDEPFSKLDKILRLEMHHLIKNIRDKHELSIILVTHDHEEAMHLSDRIAIIDNGKLLQFDSAKQIYYHPRTLKISQLFPERVYLKQQQVDSFKLSSKLDILNNNGAYDLVGIRAEQIKIVDKSQFVATITTTQFLGKEFLYTAKIYNIELSLLSNINYQIGTNVCIDFDSELEIFLRGKNVRYSC